MKNVGMIDKGVRLVSGGILLGLVFVGPQTAWGWLGAIPFITGLVSFCPLYRLFGISSCGKSCKTVV